MVAGNQGTLRKPTQTQWKDIDVTQESWDTSQLVTFFLWGRSANHQVSQWNHRVNSQFRHLSILDQMKIWILIYTIFMFEL